MRRRSVVVDGRGRRLLDDLLVAALDRALPLGQRDDVAVGVAEHLDLDVAAALDVALAEHGAVAERRRRLALGGGERVVELGGRAHDAHAAPAAAGRRLDEHREADRRDVVGALDAWSRGAPARRRARISALASIFEPIAAIAAGGGPIHVRPASIDGLGERGRLGEEAVAGVDGVGARPPGGVDEQVDAQVRVGGRVARQVHGGVARADVERAVVGVAEHGDGPDAELAGTCGRCGRRSRPGWRSGRCGSSSTSARLRVAADIQHCVFGRDLQNRSAWSGHVAMSQVHDAAISSALRGVTGAEPPGITSGTRRSRAGRGPRCCGPPTGRCRARCGCRGGR